MTLCLVYGTRPEIVKLAPVAEELREANIPFISVCTGQHTTLMRGMPVSPLSSAITLTIANDGDVKKFVARAVKTLSRLYEREEVTHVVVQGDTMSALAAARAAWHSEL
jgi:UDP-N-acetylglucosamine 2-epimerase (non-hydrolysing)